jgi:hypothetical protein
MKAHNYIGSQLSAISFRALLILIFCCTTEIALSQVLTGRVYESSSHIGLGSVRINVLTTTETTYTDKRGEFKIKAKLNDLLLISGFEYQTDTLLVTTTGLQEIYLRPRKHFLKEVKVNANNAGTTRHFNNYDPDFHNQTVRNQMDNKGNYTGGVIFRFWYWKKDERKRKKLEQEQKTNAAYQRISEVFCKDTVLKYLPLKNEEVSGFLLRYTPGTKEFMAPGFNLALYLNKCYKAYKGLSLEEHDKSAPVDSSK